MASRKAKVIWGGLGVVLLALIVGASVARESRARVTVVTGKAARKDLTSLVTASGEVKPKKYVNISANVPGRITRLYVKEGDSVRQGQVLCRIDSTRFEASTRQFDAALKAARADLDRALADVEASRLGFARARRMQQEKLISDQVFEQADAEYKMKLAVVESQRKRIAQQEALLATNQDDLDKTVVVSTMDGVVTNLQKEEGEMVIGAQSFQPTVIMTVADLSVMEVEVMVDETDIRNVKLGQAADVRVDAFEGVKIRGDVTEIGSSAIPRGTGAAATTTTTNTGNQAKDFKVTVTLKDPPLALRPGLNATADIVTARKTNVLAVPIQAVVVRELDKQGKVVDQSALQAAEGPPSPDPNQRRAKGEEKEGVFVVSNGQAAFKPVKTGIVGETDIEIVDGVGDGVEIVTGSYKTLRTLKDQAKLRIETGKDRS